MQTATSAAPSPSAQPAFPAPPPTEPASTPPATPPDVPPQTDAGGSDAATDAAPPENPAVRLVGRVDMRDSSHPRCAWPGCRIVARFDGTEASVRFDEQVAGWMQGAPSEWDVSVDGVAKPKLVLTPGTSTYPLATGLPAGIHTVELYKRSEAQDGVTQLLGFDFGGGKLVAPPPRATRTIEIIGDSQAAGYGVEGVGITCTAPTWAAKYENFHESFGAVLGTKFGADVVGTVYSGVGIVRNVWRADSDTMPVLFERADPVDPGASFDQSSISPDVVLVVLGGNDFSIGQPVDDGPLSLADFEKGYDTFVGRIRTVHANAHIFLVIPPTVSDDAPPGRMARTNVSAAIADIVAKRTAAGDARIHSASPAPARDDEMTGCEGHGSPAFHARVAGELATVIGPKLGW